MIMKTLINDGVPAMLYPSLARWQPDEQAIQLFQAILERFNSSPYAANESARDFLNALMYLEGPPTPLAVMADERKDVLANGVENHSSLKAMMSTSNLIYDETVEIHLDGSYLLVHGDNYPGGIGPAILRTSEFCQQAFKMALEKDNPSALNKLFHDLCIAACIEAKTMTLQEFIERQSDTRFAFDFTGKNTDDAKCTEYARVFFEEQRQKFERRINRPLGEDEDVRDNPLFKEDLYNTATFEAYLSGYGFLEGKTSEQIDALMAYQVDVVCTMDHPLIQD